MIVVIAVTITLIRLLWEEHILLLIIKDHLTCTSMATPSVSAAVAIITQYLTEGYYQNRSNYCHISMIDSVDLRASLLKAMIVHSTVPTKGYCLKSKKCYAYSGDNEYYEGWGRVQLDQVLRFDESKFELFLYYGQINKKKENVVFRIPIKISL